MQKKRLSKLVKVGHHISILILMVRQHLYSPSQNYELKFTFQFWTSNTSLYYSYITLYILVLYIYILLHWLHLLIYVVTYCLQPVYITIYIFITLLHYCTTCLYYSVYILLLITKLPQFYYILCYITFLYLTSALFSS